MGREQILDRIAKLFAKAESAEEFSTVAEAKAFAAKGQELLLKHKVGDDELRARLESNEEKKLFEGMTQAQYRPQDWNHKYQQKRSKWKELLAAVIADGFQCQTLVSSGSNYIWFVGLEEDAIFCVKLYARLVDLWERESLRAYDREYNRAYDKGEDTSHMRGYKASWLLSASHGLRDRLREQLASMVTGTALIRLKDVVTKYVDKTIKGKASKLAAPRSYNQQGARAGYAYGKSVGLHDEVGESVTKQIRS